MENPLEKIDLLISKDQDPDTNVQHLRHAFEGYRDVILHGNEADCPYSPGSARAHSYEQGVKLAQYDQTLLPKNDSRP